LLEPSCGNGAFYKGITDSVFIEIDKSVIKQDDVLNMDFFDYDIKNKFDTIIGNPPYFRGGKRRNRFIFKVHRKMLLPLE
jgi:adenine-specific DNA-methyltransferase